MKLFAETLAIIVNGEITQLFSKDSPASRDNYYGRIYAKTASLFETAATTAALLSPVSEEVDGHMKRYGYEVGMAFQIVDDVLDFTGEQATVGKPVANDLRNGIVTLPALYYIETHPDDPDIDAVLHSSFCDELCLERVLSATEVRAGLNAAVKYIRTSAVWYFANSDDSIAFFPHVISRTGTYLSRVCTIPVGSPIAYLVATLNEGLVALDAALKSAEVRIVSLTMPPSETNYMGVIMTGDQPACRDAAMAFQNKVLEVASNPVSY